MTSLKEKHLNLLERNLALRGMISHQFAEKLLKVSPATVRRLFREMAESRRAIRFHGGIRTWDDGRAGVIAIPQREATQSEEKELLACRAALEFNRKGLNMIHGGTTTRKVARYLEAGTYLMDSVLIAAELSRMYPGGGGPEVILTAGLLDITAGFLYGPKAVEIIRSYCADVFLTSVRGFDRDGLLETDDRAVGMIRAMMDSSRRTVVIADHRKFGHRGICRLCNWSRVDLLITVETPENSEALRQLKKSGVNLESIPVNKIQ